MLKVFISLMSIGILALGPVIQCTVAATPVAKPVVVPSSVPPPDPGDTYAGVCTGGRPKTVTSFFWSTEGLTQPLPPCWKPCADDVPHRVGGRSIPAMRGGGRRPGQRHTAVHMRRSAKHAIALRR